MKNKKNKSIYMIMVLLLLGIGVGYAILQANLQINGIAKISSNTWDIHFDNIIVNPDSVSIGDGDTAATIDSNNNCKVDFSVTLSVPGDYYEFTVDVVNAGTIDGMIGTLNKTLKVNNEVVSEVPDYLEYSVTYEDGLEIEENHLLEKNTTETYKVRVEYRSDIDKLPSATTLSMSIEPVYIQADGSGIKPGNVFLFDALINPAVIDNVASTYVTNDNGVQFNEVSSDTNGKGIYIRSGTENNQYPIYYFRGDVNNNHVIFANYCWKIVRTTDTGGIKLIYDGIPSNVYNIITNNANFTWNDDDKTWDAIITDGNSKEISFMVPSDDNYKFIVTGTTGISTGGSYYLYKDGVQLYGNGNGGGQEISYIHDFGFLSERNVIKFSYTGTSTIESPITFKIKMLLNDEPLDVGCNSAGYNSFINSYYRFDENENNLSSVGYMIDDSYDYTRENGVNWYYAPDVTYNNGTYTLTSKIINGITYNTEKKSTISGTNLNYYHYTCGNVTDTICENVKYVYHVSTNSVYYITLSSGDKVEDALLHIFSNTRDSTIKSIIDSWYQNNLIDYTNKIEDTLYCSDRSIYDLGGWNPDGGNVEDSLYFNSYDRTYNTYTPSLVCNNKNDSFTVNETSIGNGKLTYPIGLLTSDEVMLAGGKIYNGQSTFYLYNSERYWIGTPHAFFENRAFNVYLSSGNFFHAWVASEYGIRPVISLRFSTQISTGSGTGAKPYIVD